MGTLGIPAVRNRTHPAGNQRGLSLVEMMIALTLFVIVIAAIYMTFIYQQEAYLQTEARVNMVQEARAAQFFLARDIKMAGYDPSTYARTGFTQADRGEMRFTIDLSGDGNEAAVELTRFALASDTSTYADGICPANTDCRLSREWCSDAGLCGGLQPIADDVQAIEFCYIIGNMRSTTAPSALERAHITSVIVSLLMRQSYRSNNYVNENEYLPAAANDTLTPTFAGDRPDAWGPFNDPYRRKLVIFEVKARNVTMNPYLDL